MIEAMIEQPRQLESHVCGQWVRGAGVGIPLHDAATGDAVALIDATGLDYASVLRYGREVGGPALRRMGLHQRALMLKAIGERLKEDKELFYTLSARTGATRKDGWIDIEGGIVTLLSYASKARRELPNTDVLVEGEVEAFSRDATFSAQHILTPLTGIAIHINAFNFPCWGMLEKLAPTLVAGVPALIKPASQTAYLTELMVRRILSYGLLPNGSLQLICGGVGELLEHVTEQDIVTFTGSAATGRSLRRHPALVRNSVRFTMEADSLNATVLGPDAVHGTPEFALFLREVVSEMTTKAGQKCTAIRRILAPRAQCDALLDGLRGRLAEVTVGLPLAEDVRMGPLASLGQREDVRGCLRELQREAEIAFGNPEQVTVQSGDPTKGAFLNPTLLYCDRPLQAHRAHDVEAFGPVSTVMPYDTLAEGVALACRGRGSLVASVFTHDPRIAREVALGIAPLHGRILIADRVCAKTSTGHGSPLPALVHGGPGRAGGGEELGGMRAVRHYMQRTAVQGSPHLLAAITGRWMEGAPVQHDNIHPFRKSLATLCVGDQLLSPARLVTLADIEHFAGFTGDNFYAHMDQEAAAANPFFKGRVAHGYLILSFVAGLFVDPAPGPVLANYGLDSLRFLAPVYPGDQIRARLTCKEINPRETADYGEVRWDCRVTNQGEAVVAQYDVLTLVAK